MYRNVICYDVKSCNVIVRVVLCPRSVVNPLYMVLMYVFNETGKPSLFYVAPLELMMRTLVLGFMIMSLCMHGLSLVYERKKKFTNFMFYSFYVYV